MKMTGWIFLIVSWSALLAISFFCYAKVLKKKGPDSSD